MVVDPLATFERRLKNLKKSYVLRSVFAMAVPFVALVIQLVFFEFIKPFIWFAFFPAVFLSSWIGGFVSGVGATLLSTLLVWFFFIPHAPFDPHEYSRYILMNTVFFFTGILFSFLHHRLRKLVLEAEIRETESKRREVLYLEAQRIGHFGSWAWNVKTNELQWSDEMFRILGLKPQSIVPTFDELLKFVHQDDRDQLVQTTKEALARGEAIPVEYRLVQSDGTVKTVHGVGDLYRDENGEVTEMIGTAHDITERKVVEDAFRESETKFRGLLEMACDPVVIVDEQGQIEFVNRQVEQSFGYQVSELIGQTIELLIPERFRLYHLIQRKEYAKGPVSRAMGKYLQLVARKKDGTEFPVDVSLSPYKTKRGWIITAFMRDTSDRKRTEAQQRFLADTGRILSETIDYQERIQRIADIVVPPLADICLVHTKNDGKLSLKALAQNQDINVKLFEKLFLDVSLPQKNFKYGPGFVAISESAQLVEDVDNSFLLTMVGENETLFSDLKKINIKSWISVPMMTRGRNLGVISLIRCSPKRYNSTDLDMAQLVADRAALAVDNARLYHEAQVAIHLREDVLAIVSHDLKNPLSIIKGFNENLEDLLQREAVNQRTLVSTRAITRSVGQMERLINDLLDFAKIQSGNLSIRQTLNRVNDLVWDGIESIKSIADQKEIKILTEIQPNLVKINCDRGRVLQVLSNLIGNAIKFSPRNTQLQIRVFQQNAETYFSITDQGKGIPAENIPYVFDRYWQAKETEQLGTGLGLSIAKAIVEGHQGRIWVESHLGQGSTFFFTLPIESEIDSDVLQKGGPKEDKSVLESCNTLRKNSSWKGC